MMPESQTCPSLQTLATLLFLLAKGILYIRIEIQ